MTTPLRPAPACWAEIDTCALEDNYGTLRGLAPEGAECVAVVKADAYGHSLELCAPAAVRAGAKWLAVTSVPEAVLARRVAPEVRILAIGGVLPGYADAVVEHGLTPSVWTLRHVEELESAARAAGLGSLAVHLEIDTGMSRQGASLDELPELLGRFTANSPLRIEAVMTHFYASDEPDGVRSAAQLEKLAEALRMVAAARPEHLKYLSAGASAAVLGQDGRLVAKLAGEFGLRAMVRVGLALYGVAPRFMPPLEREAVVLKPVLSWKSRVAGVREIPAGAEVGYNGTFTATEPMRVALLPMGYADGFDRRLGNRFALLVRGQRAPIAGRVSMDHVVLDVTEIPGVAVGDEVVILGSQGGETISAYELADAAGTIPWVVFTGIAARVERVSV